MFLSALVAMAVPVAALSLLIPLDLESWCHLGAILSFAAALPAVLVFLKRNSSGFTWRSILALVIQALAGGAALSFAAAVSAGALDPDSAVLTSPLVLVLLACWGLLAIVCAAGIWKVRWWAFFGEVAVVTAFFLVTMAALIEPGPSHGFAADLNDKFRIVLYGIVYLVSVIALTGKGWHLLRNSRTGSVESA